MKVDVTLKEFEAAEIRMEVLLKLATKKGGFSKLTKKESAELDACTQVVSAYEALHYKIPLPETLQGLLKLKMYENKLKQKELAQAE